MSLKHPRPLSPHLRIYRPQLTSLLSVLHRFTGVALYGGGIAWVFYLLSLAAGPLYFQETKTFLGSFVGKVFLGGWIFSIYYHMGNGIRHLFWDFGDGLDLKTVYRTGYIVVGVSFFCTALTFLWICGGGHW